MHGTSRGTHYAARIAYPPLPPLLYRYAIKKKDEIERVAKANR